MLQSQLSCWGRPCLADCNDWNGVEASVIDWHCRSLARQLWRTEDSVKREAWSIVLQWPTDEREKLMAQFTFQEAGGGGLHQYSR